MSNYYYGNTEEEAIATAKADGWQEEFIGMNCNDWLEDGDECNGWDGEDRRCDCALSQNSVV